MKHLKLRYRDKHGRFLSRKSASRRSPKNVISEVYNSRTGKAVRRKIGFFKRIFGLKRKQKPKRSIRKPPEKLKTTIRRTRTEYVVPEYEEETVQEPEWEEEVPAVEESSEDDEDEMEWQELEDAFPELDDLDEIQDWLDHEDDWDEEKYKESH